RAGQSSSPTTAATPPNSPSCSGCRRAGGEPAAAARRETGFAMPPWGTALLLSAVVLLIGGPVAFYYRPTPRRTRGGPRGGRGPGAGVGAGRPVRSRGGVFPVPPVLRRPPPEGFQPDAGGRRRRGRRGVRLRVHLRDRGEPGVAQPDRALLPGAGAGAAAVH